MSGRFRMNEEHLPFRDRRQAGRVLAEHLEHYRGRPNRLVLALPRGGVAVGSSSPLKNAFTPFATAAVIRSTVRSICRAIFISRLDDETSARRLKRGAGTGVGPGGGETGLPLT